MKVEEYIPRFYPIKPWNETRSFYSDLIDNHNFELTPMLDLVDYIIKSKISDRVFGTISNHTMLTMSIYEKIELGREMLRIYFDSTEKKWFYKYYSRPDKLIQFEREYDKELGIEKFNQFISFVKW
ncbi:hypothetical protein [Polaribacter porphyrae]|uniref:Uncharacterized protein n=1 Tax=Polaribacter porphyrae TaxID=1137780 RepID=A0A2S7WQ59_9FLAO|nr:hypothetical protein [Polaribacter porphyrae]PQJ79750.1 hypothetical protein BTO18_11450 [Polaribacter porphyrae]